MKYVSAYQVALSLYAYDPLGVSAMRRAYYRFALTAIARSWLRISPLNPGIFRRSGGALLSFFFFFFLSVLPTLIRRVEEEGRQTDLAERYFGRSEREREREKRPPRHKY